MTVGTIMRSTLVLAAVAFVSSYVLSHLDKQTRPEIEKYEKEKRERALPLVLPGYEIGEKRTDKIDGKEFNYWIGVKTVDEIEVKGYAFLTASPGYSGDVESMVGIDDKGMVLGISILRQTETPGLGARCQEVASKDTFWSWIAGRSKDKEDEKTVPWFQEQFTGLSLFKKIAIKKLGDWKPEMKESLLAENSVSAMTGATVTTTTVRDSLVIGFANLKKAGIVIEEPVEEEVIE
jgi:electron transport complex protein RnfG